MESEGIGNWFVNHSMHGLILKTVVDDVFDSTTTEWAIVQLEHSRFNEWTAVDNSNHENVDIIWGANTQYMLTFNPPPI